MIPVKVRQSFTRRIVIGAAVAFAFAMAVPYVGFAQSDPMPGMWVGTWKLNQAKSTFRPGPPPRSVTLIGVVSGQGVIITADSVTASGTTTHAVFTLVFDGKFHPITGTQVADANAILKTDPYTAEYAYTKDGVLVQVGTYRFAMDGRSLTIASKGISALSAGQRVDNITVYDKQ
jgi:hypothetical protein